MSVRAVEDVVVRRCRVRLVRRGGWSWGRDPRRLVRAVVDALPALIDAALEETAAGESGERTLGNLRVTVRVEHRDLTAGAAGMRLVPEWDAIGGAGELTVALGRAASVPDVAAVAEHSSDPARPEDTAPRSGYLTSVLVRAWRRGSAAALLRELPDDVLERWCARLGSRRRRLHLPASAPGGRYFVPSEPARETRGGGGHRREALISRLLAFAELVAGGTPEHVAADTVAPAEPQALGDPGPAGAARRVARAGDASTTSVPERRRAGEVSGPGQKPRDVTIVAERLAWTFDGRVERALPFLLLPSLDGIGYLDAVGAALDAASARTFATALALKIMDPPGDGRRRHPEQLASVAVFAGTAAPASDAAIAAAAPRLEASLPFLDSILTDALAEGHDAARPMLLHEWNGSTVVFEPEGLFLAASTATAAPVARTLAAFDCPFVALTARVSSDVRTALGTAGIDYVVTRRGRGERRLVALRSAALPTLWSTAPRPSLGRADALLLADPSPIDDLLDELDARPICRAGGAALNASVAFAASTSLGVIAHALWPGPGSGPALAWERLRDISARVTTDERTVLVSLPLGRRFLDLRREGLLRDVPGVPWLDDRRVEFTGG